MISTVVVSFNEEEKLRGCLKSVENFADEKIVIDLNSADDTRRISEELGAKVYQHMWVEYVELVRNFAFQKTSGDWILVLDPDERITKELAEELKKIAKNGEVSAVNIPRKNIFFDKWISHTNWWPDRHIRFFKKNRVSWEDKIHSYPKVDGIVLNLAASEKLAIEHFGYDNINQFVERQNRYSLVEAKNRYKQGERFSNIKLIWKPLRQFLVRFIKHQGFMDGFLGLSLTLLMMIYEVIVMVKIWELQEKER